jgi:hypothetical protein
MHAVADARFLYFCPGTDAGVLDAEAKPMPSGGLAYGKTWIRGANELDFDAGLSLWVIAVDAPLGSDVGCADINALEAADAGSIRVPPVVVKGERDATLADAGTLEGTDAAAAADASAVADAAAGSKATALDAALLDTGSDVHDASLGQPGLDASAGDAAVELAVTDMRVAPFVTFPPGSFARAKSSLLIAAGCIGPVSRAQAAYCGTASAVASSLQPYWLPLSRVTTFDSVGLQFVNASDVPRATLRSTPSDATLGAFFSVGYDVGIGEIAPQALHTGVPLADIGTDLRQVRLEIETSSGAEPLFSQSWQDTLQAAPDVELHNAGAFSIVLVGAVTVPRNRAFNPPRLVLLSNDPARPAR